MGAALVARDTGIINAIIWGLLALALAGSGFVSVAAIYLIIAAGGALYAVRYQRRFDSILTRSLAAALAEGGDATLAEAA
jgi:hypothetical protein